MVKAFIAYPSGRQNIHDAIQTAYENSRSEELILEPWEMIDVIGFKIGNLVREKIDEADCLVADITFANANVYYEIGYALARGKPIATIVNSAYEGATVSASKIAILDTFGHIFYENGDDLTGKLRGWKHASTKISFTQKRNHSQPLFVLDTFKKTDFRNHVFGSIENSQVKYRRYDPAEVPRYTADQAIADVSASAGVIIPLLAQDIFDSLTHNIRASFVLGLSHGYSIDALVIQYEKQPAPEDYRDFIRNSTARKETENHVEKYCADVLIWNQKEPPARDSQDKSPLRKLYFGSSFAENETETLAGYFVKTAQFAMALHAEGAAIVGRKGSGKSAIFLQIVEDFSRHPQICIVDLRPASHNLSEMREAILEVESAGVFDHTISAFWQYVVYIEILLKIRQLVLPKSRNNFDLQERIRSIEKQFKLTDDMVAGDFTSRLESAVQDVVDAASRISKPSNKRQILTNLMYEQSIHQLREAVVSFDDQFEEIVLLIDDLDKGWPPLRAESQDVMMVKHLIEILGKIRRDLTRKQVGFKHFIFLRSDIYEKLVQVTSDRGKYNAVRIDWSDPDQLRNLLALRASSELLDKDFDKAWSNFNTKFREDDDVVSRMIEACLRRPRFLIDLAGRVLSFAINRGHLVVTEDDLNSGLEQMSRYLVSDFGYEMRDIAGTPEDIFYQFIGTEAIISVEDIEIMLEKDTLGIGFNETIELLLWYGFLGLVGPLGHPVYIYDLDYDFRRLEAERKRFGSEQFAINPAFLRGLTAHA